MSDERSGTLPAAQPVRRARIPTEAMPDAEDVSWYTRRWLALAVQYYEAVVEQLWLAPGDRVLDVACGPGALVAQLSPIVGPHGLVMGLDWSAAMLHAGIRLARRQDVRNAAFVLGDLRTLPFSEGSFDAASCVLGFGGGDGPRQGLVELRRVLHRGGRVAVVTPAPAEISPGTGILLHILARHGVVGGHAAGYEGAATATVIGWLREAGFVRTGCATLNGALRRLDFDDFWADALAGRLPGSALYRAQPAQTQAAIRAEVRRTVQQFSTATRLSLPTAVVLAWGVA